MAIQFMQMPRIGEGVSSLLDFSPLAAGLQNYQRGSDMAQQRQNMTQIGQTYANQGAGAAAKQAAGLGEVEAGMQFNRQATMDKDRQIKMLGGVAQAAKFEKDPARRALLWQTGLKRAGVNPAELDPEELDPMTGPDVFLAASGMAQDPRESQLMDLKIAQAQKSLAAPVGGDAPSNVREYEYVKSLPPAEQARYMEVKRAQSMLNAGTQFVDPSGRRAPIPIDNVGKQAQEEIGIAQGKAAAAAPGDISTADSTLELLNSIRNDPNREAGTGVSSVQNMIMATPGYDFQNKVDQAKSGAFLTAIQQLRGMGSLSNAEGQTATSAVTRMNTATSENAFLEALNDYEQMILKGRSIAQQRLGAAPNAQPATPVPQGATGGPQPGMIEDGYRFKGGNPSDPNAWEKVQ